MSYSIKTLTSMLEAEGVAEVQRQAWKMDDIGIVPNFETRAVADVGFVYVAKDENETIIGFIYGYHHFPNIHYSHMMAVLPEWQGKGVGFALKKYHRKQALGSSHFVNSIQWTVDPLLPNNAYLNFAKLGCICNTYKINYYGDPKADGVEIYAGVPTDRFKVVWPIHEDRVKLRMDNYRQERISKSDLFNRSPPINKISNDRYRDKEILFVNSFVVQVPGNYQAIRQNDLRLAREWRVKFREICLKYFDKGYKVIDYHAFKEEEKYENYYEFSKELK